MIDLAVEAAALGELWSPKVVGRINDQFVKVAKVKGELCWHAHAGEDEMFLVLAGELAIAFEDRPTVHLGPGQAYIVPRGVRHNPVAAGECLIALIEPATTAHTGEVVMEKTRSIAEQIAAFAA